MFISCLLRHGQDIEGWTDIVYTLSWKTMDYIVSALVVKSYFDQRSHHVYCKGCRSKTTLVTWCSHSTGFPIPRSQLLGPLLFLLYIKDLPNSSSLLYFIIFAEYVIFWMSLLILLCIVRRFAEDWGYHRTPTTIRLDRSHQRWQVRWTRRIMVYRLFVVRWCALVITWDDSS